MSPTLPAEGLNPLRAELDETRTRLRDLEETLDAIRNGEVDGLVMTGDHPQQIFSLQGSQEPYRLLIERMSEGAFTLSREGDILYANEALAHMLQQPLERIIGSAFQNAVTPADRPVFADLMAAGWEGSSHGEIAIRATEGLTLPVGISINRVEFDPEVVLGVVATDLTTVLRTEELERRVIERTAALAAANDELKLEIAERMRADAEIKCLNAGLEQRVKERTAELVDSNRELEAFSYSVSHDLRAPLRAIDGYSRILVEDYNDRLDDDGRRVLGVVCSEAQRMGRLIDELLNFSRVGRRTMELRETDMLALAETAYEEAIALEPGRKISAEMDALPAAHGEPIMLRQVWANLLMNAVKFTRHCNAALIQIGATHENGETIYFVRDNGAGFDMAHVGKLFGVFQRLHGEAEFEGTGVGLAFVKRIVQRHGGRVWAESAIDQGATFFFSLPDQPDQAPTYEY
jgi:PAS domain S-box-containing protein